jgi:Rps23 Pro-64 3,4-dihydroxylase Tpa1-like proline 4-hydroxylase
MFSHLEPYKEIFKNEGQVTLPNIFPDSQVKEIWESYINRKDFEVNFFTDKIITTKKGSKEYFELTKQVNNMVSQDKFCYRFSRTSWTHPYLETLWSNPAFVDTISYITEYQNLTWVRESTFTSKYESGDFLYTHTDKGNGRIAFIYQLTKDWLPGYGGLFMRMNNWIDIDSAVLPKFNQLTIFDVANEGTPHIVTQVVPNLNNARIAYSGWLA